MNGNHQLDCCHCHSPPAKTNLWATTYGYLRISTTKSSYCSNASKRVQLATSIWSASLRYQIFHLEMISKVFLFFLLTWILDIDPAQAINHAPVGLPRSYISQPLSRAQSCSVTTPQIHVHLHIRPNHSLSIHYWMGGTQKIVIWLVVYLPLW